MAKDDLDKTEPDTIMPHLSKKIFRQCFQNICLHFVVERIPIESVDKENELLRGKNRYSKLFSSYPPQADVSSFFYFQ